MLGDSIVLEWDKRVDIAIIDDAIASSLIGNSWAKELEDKFAEELNVNMLKLAGVVDVVAEAKAAEEAELAAMEAVELAEKNKGQTDQKKVILSAPKKPESK